MDSGPQTSIPRTHRHRQLRLLSLDSALSLRFGAEFFRSVPACPGVYRFYDSADGLLYIGQSRNLCARIGSYRHVTPEQHSKRILRLVHRIARIEWQICATADEAIELERVLLLEHRPPFNRAGVWEGPPWWLSANGEGPHLTVSLGREGLPGALCAGPLPSAFRYVHAAMMRCVYRLAHPHCALAEYPLGLLNMTVPLVLSLRVDGDGAKGMAASLVSFASGDVDVLLARLNEMPPALTPTEQEFWTEQVTSVQRFARKRRSTLSSPINAEHRILRSDPCLH